MEFVTIIAWCGVAVSVAGILGSLWVLRCNSRTTEQRCRLVGFVFSGPGWEIRKRAYEAVPYERHLHYVATFRDPYVLYAKAGLFA